MKHHQYDLWLRLDRLDKWPLSGKTKEIFFIIHLYKAIVTEQIWIGITTKFQLQYTNVTLYLLGTLFHCLPPESRTIWIQFNLCCLLLGLNTISFYWNLPGSKTTRVDWNLHLPFTLCSVWIHSPVTNLTWIHSPVFNPTWICSSVSTST